MSVDLGKDSNEEKPKSFIMRNQWLVSVVVILLVPFLLFKGCTALMDSNREKYEASKLEEQKEKSEKEAKKEEEKKAKEEKQRQDQLDSIDRQASIDRAKAMDKDLNAASQVSATKALTQEDCDTVNVEDTMMTKSINEGNNNRKNSEEYLKLQKKVSICKKQGMIE